MAFVTFFFLLLFTVNEVRTQSGSDVQTLLTKLFDTDSYNKKIRPIMNQSDVLQISVDLILTSIIEFDDQQESLKSSGYLAIYWVDEYLQWDPTGYNGLDLLFLPQDDVWRPDISLRNTFTTFKGLGSSYLNLRVDYTGQVSWEPFQVLQSTCDVDVTFFPYDVQKCELKFIAWSYTKDEVDLNEGSKGIILEEYSTNAVWDIESTSASETNTHEAAVIFTINLKRKSAFYVINIIIPVILLSVLNVFAFVIPVSSGEKASYAVTVFLSLAVFLTIVSAQMPTNSVNVSILSVYITSMATVSTLIVMMCIIEIRLATRTVEEHPVGKFYKTLYKFSMFLQRRKWKDKVEPIGQSPKNSNEKLKKEDEFNPEKGKVITTWVKIVSALDFLLFFIFLLLTFIISLVLFVMCTIRWK